MTAVILSPTPMEVKRRAPTGGPYDPADVMPFSTRRLVAAEINRLWEEFVREMHDGSTFDAGVPEKFWKYVLAGG